MENQERTLEELGAHLSESKLKMADLRDVSKSLRDAQWAPDKEASHCRLCEKEFSISRRRHHCRHCGNIFCHGCSDNTMPLPSSARPVRVCDTCHTQLLQRYSNSENWIYVLFHLLFCYEYIENGTVLHCWITKQVYINNSNTILPYQFAFVFECV